MTRMKLVSAATGEELVPFTPEEEAEARARETEWASSRPRHDAIARIYELEAEITQRRLRDAVLTQEGRDWLNAQEALIEIERVKL